MHALWVLPSSNNSMLELQVNFLLRLLPPAAQHFWYSASHPSCDAFGPLIWQFITASVESRVFQSPPSAPIPLPTLSRIILQRLPAHCGNTLRVSFHHASAFSAGAQKQEQKEHFRTARAQGQRTSFPLCLRLPLYGGAAIFNVYFICLWFKRSRTRSCLLPEKGLLPFPKLKHV